MNSTATEQTITICTSPASGEVLGTSPLHTREDVARAISAARQAQHYWQAIPPRQRAKIILRIRNYIVQHVDSLAEIISRDSGKVRIDALTTEVLAAAMAVDYYSRNTTKFLKDKTIRPASILLFNKRNRITRIPYGVVGIISPWNYPFSIPFSGVIMNLLAGNGVLLKTASETQHIGLALKECIESAGLPDGLFHYLNLPGRIAGDAFLQEGVDKLFFTGSVAVGKYLMKKASETLTPLCLELGGNDAMIVCPDADLHRASSGAVWAGLSNSGQSCAGVERIYVHEKIYDPFMVLLKQKVEGLRVGADIDFNCDIGLMTTTPQIVTVQKHIDDALQKGAQIFAQASLPAGNQNQHALAPTVLCNVNHDMLVMKDETFGPVLAVMKVATIEEAIALANDSYLGLTGSVWSRDHKKARSIARQVQAGVVTINDHLMSHGMPETPWGGFKQSGLGRTHGQMGFDEGTQPKVIIDDFLPGVKKNFWWHPYDERLYTGIKSTLTVLYGKGVIERSRALWRSFKSYLRTFRV